MPRVRRLRPDDVSLIATIDRSEHVDVRQGCHRAEAVHPALFAKEPEDIHLVCSLP